jgi:hypothetical protein
MHAAKQFGQNRSSIEINKDNADRSKNRIQDSEMFLSSNSRLKIRVRVAEPQFKAYKVQMSQG